MPTAHTYRPTEAQYKGGAKEMYVTYELEQRTRGGNTASYPRVKRVYVAGDVKDWRTGTFTNRRGRRVHGVRIAYDQRRAGFRRGAFEGGRGRTRYRVGPSSVPATEQRFTKVVELPDRARDVQFHTAATRMPARYRRALQRVR